VQRASRPPEISCAGYLCFQSSAEGTEEWAALLAVDERGLPQEFLYSGPLRPTPVQSILYQDQLSAQVRLSLVRSLFRGLRSRLGLVAVSAEEWDATLAEDVAPPVLVIGGEKAAWLGEPPPTAEGLRRRIEDAVGETEPLGRARAALAYVVEYERSRKAAEP